MVSVQNVQLNMAKRSAIKGTKTVPEPEHRSVLQRDLALQASLGDDGLQSLHADGVLGRAFVRCSEDSSSGRARP